MRKSGVHRSHDGWGGMGSSTIRDRRPDLQYEVFAEQPKADVSTKREEQIDRK